MPLPEIPADPGALRGWRDATLFRLMHRAARAERTETVARVQLRGHPTVGLGYAELLSNLDTDGTTISDLARRVGTTRQATSQQLAIIEADGYVARQPAPHDARAVLVRPTARGLSLLRDALAVVADIENEYEELLGANRLATLRQTLLRLLEQIDPGGGLGQA